MSGFEIAGLVLAIIPIVSDALKDAPQTTAGKTSRSFVKAASERREFARQLLFLDTSLRNALLELFKRISHILSDSQLSVLEAILGNSSVIGSKFMKLLLDLVATNPDKVREILADAVDDIRDILEQIEEALIQIVVHTKINRNSGREKLRAIIKADEDGSLSIRDHFTARLNFARSSTKRRRLLQKTKESIEQLKLVVNVQKKNEELLDEWKTIVSRHSYSAFSETFRNCCNNLYDALSCTWNCRCHKSPAAMLRLEKRALLEERKSADVLFSLLITFNDPPRSPASGNEDNLIWQFREIEVIAKTKYVWILFVILIMSRNQKNERLPEDTETQEKTVDDHKIVNNMCQTLSSCHTKTCTRFMLKESSLLLMNESLEASAATKAKVPAVTKTIHIKHISLHELLDRSSTSVRLTRLTREECLRLAVILSVSLLQLYSTPWCPDTLSTHSIQLATLSAPDEQTVNVDHPYVTSKIERQKPNTPNLPINGHHPDLVALGIMLLELSEKKSISQWWVEQTFSEPLPANLDGRVKAACKWYEEEASERMNPSYRWAFRHCLNVYSLDIVPRKRMTFADAGFRNAVYRNIVTRLEDAYKEYTEPIAASTLLAI